MTYEDVLIRLHEAENKLARLAEIEYDCHHGLASGVGGWCNECDAEREAILREAHETSI